MTNIVEAFVAMLFLSWPVAEGHPAHGYLAEPEETRLVMEVMGFSDAESCEAFIAEAQAGEGVVPVEGAQVVHAECAEF